MKISRLNALVCNALKFESLEPLLTYKVHFGMQVHLKNIYFKFAYRNHRVKIKSQEEKCVSIILFAGGCAFD